MLYVATEARLHRGPDGVIRADLGESSYTSWQPLLEAFSEIAVVARVADVTHLRGQAVEGLGVRVAPLPNYQGARQLLGSFASVRRAVRSTCNNPEATYAGRVPGVISTLVQSAAKRLGAPFLAFVVADAAEVISHGPGGRITRLAAPFVSALVRRQLLTAQAATYVTERTLQQRYPVRRGVPELTRSDVTLTPESFASAPRDWTARFDGRPWKIVAVGSHDAFYKGHDVLLRAAAILRESGLQFQLTIVGGGQHHNLFRPLATELDLDEHVRFTGRLPDARAVRSQLEGADLFVMPSLTEGLPRALVEAMALGLPCIATAVGGIPELLPPECLVTPGDAPALALAINQECRDPRLMTSHSEINLERAGKVAAQADKARLVSFLREVLTHYSNGVRP